VEDKIGICQYHQFSSCRHTAPSENLSSWHQDGYHTQGTSSRHPHEETKHRDLQTSCWSKGYEINLRQRQNANNCARLMWHCCYTYVYTLYLFFRCHSISAGKNRDTAVPAEGNGDLQFSRDHCCQGRSNPVARLWADTLGESWPPGLTSSYASIDFWCQLVVSPATTTSSWMKQSNTAVAAEGNGDLQTLICVLVARPRSSPTLLNPVPWQNWMAAYLGYTLRMKTLLRGWPIMVHDTHTSRRFKSKLKSFLFHAAYTRNTVWTLECAIGLLVGGALLQVTVVTVTVTCRAADELVNEVCVCNSGEDYAERRKLVIQESKYLGGDMEHTHLVKGLDYALLEKVRQFYLNSCTSICYFTLSFPFNLLTLNQIIV